MKVGELVRIKQYEYETLFIIIEHCKEYSTPVYYVRGVKTGTVFKMAGEALSPVGVVDA